MTPELNSAFFNSTDVIPIANGGTGQTTAFAGLVALANGGASTAGRFLKVNAGNTALEYDTIDLNSPDVTGILPIAKGGTGGSTGGATTAKAWVNFNGTLATPITPRASYNVSSVTKNGTGDYTINFSTPMADANYSWQSGGNNYLNGTGNDVMNVITTTTYQTSSSLRIITKRSSGGGTIDNQDHSIVTIAIFGN